MECCLILNKNVYMNMNYSYPPTMYKFLVENHYLHFLFNFCDSRPYQVHQAQLLMNSNIPFIHCSKKTVVNVNVNMSLHATMTRMGSNQEIPQNLLISMLLSTQICTLLAFIFCGARVTYTTI